MQKKRNGYGKKTLAAVQRKLKKETLNEGEIEAKGDGHAEMKVLNKSKEINKNLESIGVSRGICSDCEKTLKENNVNLESKTAGKKSVKNRS